MIKKKYACKLWSLYIATAMLSIFLTGCSYTNQPDTWQKNVVDDISAEYSTSAEEISLISCDKEIEQTETIFVHVCGAVMNPGVYEIADGSRVYEALAMAGGMTQEADSTCLNLAGLLQDGIQIRVLTKEEAVKQVTVQESTLQNANGQRKVNINTATTKELTQLSGIGESRARDIIAYREKNGAFSSIEQIKKVNGIKEGLFQKIKDEIVVN